MKYLVKILLFLLSAVAGYFVNKMLDWLIFMDMRELQIKSTLVSIDRPGSEGELSLYYFLLAVIVLLIVAEYLRDAHYIIDCVESWNMIPTTPSSHRRSRSVASLHYSRHRTKKDILRRLGLLLIYHYVMDRIPAKYHFLPNAFSRLPVMNVWVS